MIKKENKKAQSTLEYILVLTAIIGVIIWAAGSLVKPAVQKSLNAADKALSDAAGKI